MIRHWLRENRGLLVSAVILLAALAAAAAAYPALSRRMIDAAYHGRAVGPLNRMIRGQAVHPVTHYYRDADHLATAALGMGLIVLLLGGLLLMRIDGRRTIASLRVSLTTWWTQCRQAWRAAWTSQRLDLAVLGLLVLWAAVLRGSYLSQPMRFDEAFTATRYIDAPLLQSLSTGYYPNNHLLHTLLGHISTRLLGFQPWAVRLPAFLAGVALVPAAYVLARAWYGRSAALIAAALVAGSSPLIEFSANARGYTLLAFCTVVMVTLADHLRREDSLARWLMWAVTSALGFYAIPVMLHPWAIIMLWLAASALIGDTVLPPRPFLLRLAAAVGLTGLLTLGLYLPVLTMSGYDALVHNRFLQPLSLAEYGRQVPAHLGDLWRQWNRDLPPVLQGLLVAGATAALLLQRRLTGHRVPPVLVALVWLVPFNLQQRVIYISPRIWLFLLPLYLMLASAGLAAGLDALLRLRRRASWTPIPAAMALLLGLWIGTAAARSGSIRHSSETGVWPAAEPLSLYLKTCLHPGDRLVMTEQGIVPAIYYFRLHGVPVDCGTPLASVPGRVIVAIDPAAAETLVATLELCDSHGATLARRREWTLLQHVAGAEVYALDPSPRPARLELMNTQSPTTAP